MTNEQKAYVDRVLARFDEKYAYQDLVQNEIPLVDMHDFLKSTLQEVFSCVPEREEVKYEETTDISKFLTNGAQHFGHNNCLDLFNQNLSKIK